MRSLIQPIHGHKSAEYTAEPTAVRSICICMCICDWDWVLECAHLTVLYAQDGRGRAVTGITQICVI